MGGMRHRSPRQGLDKDLLVVGLVWGLYNGIAHSVQEHTHRGNGKCQ